MHEVLVNRLGGLSLPRKSVVRLTDRPDMTFDVYRGRKTTIQQQQQQASIPSDLFHGHLFHKSISRIPGVTVGGGKARVVLGEGEGEEQKLRSKK